MLPQRSAMLFLSLVAFGFMPNVDSTSSTFVHMLPQEVPMPRSASLNDGLEAIANTEFQSAVDAWNHRQPERGLELYRRSAQKGHEVGEYCYRFGLYHELPPADMKQALTWYKRGARMNHRGSVTMLGKLLFVAGKLPQAARVLQRTALPASGSIGGPLEGSSRRLPNVVDRGLGGETGDSLAQWFLAEIFLKSAKLRPAVKWWKRSAGNGDTDAMMRLYVLFSQGGHGIPQEIVRSNHWLLAAAAHGHKEALDMVNWASTIHTKAEDKWIRLMESYGWF
eukprot:TRINITY_DN102869_c0_g1_i1.p1 TRINITY_DN102869_c0_g1~~TRINITY_DN102869_c0_g1_i1.p1  ORF type:complete len:280 (-),score=37.77 TRINITY_DN102869_c0_g1_i1:537-1376(-)